MARTAKAIGPVPAAVAPGKTEREIQVELEEPTRAPGALESRMGVEEAGTVREPRWARTERLGKRAKQRRAAGRRIVQARNTFYTLFDANPTPTALMSATGGTFIGANAAFLRYFSLELEDLLGRTAEEAGIGVLLASSARMSLREQQRREKGFQNYEMELALPSGKAAIVLASLQEVHVDGTDAVLAAFTDITERKQGEEIFRRIMDGAPDPTVVMDANGDILLVNKQVESVFGYPRESLIGKNVKMLMPDRYRAMHTQVRIGYYLEAEPRQMGGGGRLYALKSDGTEFPVEVNVSPPLETQAGMLLMAAIRDVTAQVEAEQSIRRLAARLTQAEQVERDRISQVLHDDLQQRLYAIRAQISMLNDAYAEQDRAAVEDGSTKLEAGLAEAIAITRNLSADISPIVLRGEGLSGALSWLCGRMKEQYGLEVALELDGREAAPDDSLRLVLFRAVRELLFNVVKHAETARAAIQFVNVDGHAEIIVSDQGKGFDAGAVMMNPGIVHGLVDIQQRLELMGCQMEVSSRPGGGTRAVIRCASGSQDEG